MHYTLYTMHSTLHTIPYKLYTIHFTLYTIHYTLYTIHFCLGLGKARENAGVEREQAAQRETVSSLLHPTPDTRHRTLGWQGLARVS